MAEQTETWELWFPQAAATGLLFGRGRLDPTSTLLVHAVPPMLSVAVRSADGTLLAEGIDLPATAETPMARLVRDGTCITREDIWPTAKDLGSIVLLAGGEVGTLVRWWHADDSSEWCWQLEFYNHR